MYKYLNLANIIVQLFQNVVYQNFIMSILIYLLVLTYIYRSYSVNKITNILLEIQNM